MNRKSCDVPDATIHRLPLYLEKLKLLQAIGVEDVSNRQLAESLDIKASQLRHDFHYFGGFSRPGRPYRVQKLVSALETIIGIAEPVPTAIVGARPSNFVRDWASRADFPRPVASPSRGRLWLLILPDRDPRHQVYF